MFLKEERNSVEGERKLCKKIFNFFRSAFTVYFLLKLLKAIVYLCIFGSGEDS